MTNQPTYELTENVYMYHAILLEIRIVNYSSSTTGCLIFYPATTNSSLGLDGWAAHSQESDLYTIPSCKVTLPPSKE